MAVQDRRHSIEVARRFIELAPGADRSAVAAALLHDVGKQVAGLGTMWRVVATVVGPRTKRLRDYHLHEPLGAALLREAGSDDATIALVEGRGPFADVLRSADDV
jgi:predicted HD phosphohydrolase